MNIQLQREQFLTDISKSNKLLDKIKQEPTKEGKELYREFLIHHWQTMRLKKFFRKPGDT